MSFGLNQDVARLRSPTKDKRMDQDLVLNQDVARLRSPTRDERIDQDHFLNPQRGWHICRNWMFEKANPHRG